MCTGWLYSNNSQTANLNPRKGVPFGVEALEDTRDSNMRSLRKQMSGLGDTASSLLAQAVQQSTHEARRRKKRKKDRDKQDSLKQLVNLLQGKKNKKDKKEKRKKRRDPRGIKPDPDGSGGGDSSSSSGSSRSSRASQCDEAGSGEDSDLSLEAPLKRRATKEPASVLGMLVKHAQAQLDQGSFLETPDVRPRPGHHHVLYTEFMSLSRP